MMKTAIHLVCTIEGCRKKHECKGFCQMHYRRFIVHGDPSMNLNSPKDSSVLFFSKVNKTDGCWLWTGGADVNGYGRFGIKKDGRKSTVLAHRYSWETAKGQIPDGLFALHKCDTPACVNPDHLFLGTQQANVDDMLQKERHSFGESHYAAKLTTEKVILIKAALAKGESKKSIAQQHGTSRSNISLISSGKRWRHV